jgi:hypothetical protein
VDFKAEGGTAKDTTVDIHKKSVRAGKMRDASMNPLVNSALASMFKI